MAEVDYQMALLLQYKFEQEHKRKENTDSDHLLALELQEGFKCELEVERPTNNLVYNTPRGNNSKCLVDPSWEVIDPTPDIHVLFITFNKRFFWDQLGSVTVSWSKRMTTSAGICSYQGRGGMCSITLSEPLLKLRPRKDLVETLLHEMIHAYLFVTNNNRDRDGHGPEFHKHMNRINAEAGTNITVYHDFHDEVRLYKQHWWRCDGPCQQRHPYFGMIRRATNRAPGPNDLWWAGHVRDCGGTFIKVKSPEVPAKAPKATAKKKKDPPKEASPKNDIRNYINNTSTKVPSNNQDGNKENISRPKNIQTISNPTTDSASDVGNVIASKTSNIFGFTNLNGGGKNPKKLGGTAVKNAGSSTFVVTNKGSKSANNEDNNISAKPSTSTSSEVIQPFSGTGRTLSDNSNASTSTNKSYSTVRDHWLKKFNSNNSQRKRVSDSSIATPNPPKQPKLNDNCDIKEKSVECPVCTKKFKPEDLNAHLDICLESPNNDSKECVICGQEIPSLDHAKHISACAASNFNDVFDDEMDLTECSICSKLFDPKTDPQHIKNCQATNRVDLVTTNNDDEGDNIETKNCPACNKQNIPSQEYGPHLQSCLLSMCDDFDKAYESMQTPNKTVSCLACGKDILKSELDSHLEDCMSMSNVFDTSKVTLEDSDEEVECQGNNNYNCPFCLKLVLEDEMQAHLDQCLKSEVILDDD